MGPARTMRSSIQTKLVVGQSGDKYEREADHVADRVATGQPVGEVSRIPAGGLGAQRMDDAGSEAQQTAEAPQQPIQKEETSTSAAQAQRRAQDREPAQREGNADAQAQREEDDAAESKSDEKRAQREEDGTAQSKDDEVRAQKADDADSSEAQAQTKCADCEAKAKAQQKDERGDVDRAQMKCAACAGKEKAQRQDEGGSAEARTSGASEGDVQRQAAGANEEEVPEEDQPDTDAGEEEGASRDCPPGTDESAGAETGPEGGGAETESEEGAESEGAGTEGAEGEEAGAEGGRDSDDLGCGEEGGGEGEAPAGAAPAGGQSCGATEETTEGEEGAGGPEGTAAPPQEETQAPPVASAPACADPVPAAEEREGDPASGEPAAEAGGGGSAGGECGTAQRKDDDSDASPVQETEDQELGQRQEQGDEKAAQTRGSRKRDPRGLDTGAASRLIHSRGAGEPLKPNVKHRLEHSLGIDVNGIRVHSDGNAHAANRALRAKAFTHRNHIFLGAGQSQHDLNLMAHEGTHVLQQDGIARRKPESPIAGRDAGAEAKAPSAAAATLSGHAKPGTSPSVTAAGATAIGGAAREGAAGKDDRTKKGDKGPATRPAGKGQAGGAGGAGAAGPGEAEAGPPAVPAGEGAAAHPGAAAAAAARLAGDRERMAGVSRRLGREASRQKGPAATRPKQRLASTSYAKDASDAAPSPDLEPQSQAEEARARALEPVEGGEIKKETFLEMVDRKLNELPTPSTMGEMDEFKDREGAKGLKEGLDENVKSQTQTAGQPIKGPLDAPLNQPAKRKEKGLGDVPTPPGSHALRAREAAPAPRAEEEVTLEPNREQVEEELAKHRLTKERLEKANDPRFTAVQKAREEVHEHASRAPGEFRREETAKRASVEHQMAGAERQTGAAMRGAHAAGQGRARVHQGIGVVREAMDRARIASDIDGLYKAAERKVREKLEWLSGKDDGTEGEVDTRFTAGEKAARDDFEGYVDDQMSAWKLRRYGGRAMIPLIGGLLAAGTWAYDQLAGIDHHEGVREIFVEGRKRYLEGLRATIVDIAGLVETTLTQCEGFIDDGKRAIDDYIENRGLTPSQKIVARDTARGVSERFDELREEVNSKREELADNLVDRYRESEEAIDTRIKEIQAENRGLVRKFIDKVKEIVNAIRNFKNKIGPILSEAGDIIDEVLDDPIGFLANMLEAIDRGFTQFKNRIDVHLKAGIITWLTGTLGSAGVEVPKDASAASIGGLVLQVLGITYDKLKTRALRMLGPRAGAAIEAVEGKLTTLFRGGPGALWEELQEDVGNLKDTILDEIKSWVITRIVTAAVKKLAMMFNPAGAIIQAILTIYHVVMFFLENIERILDLVRTVVRSAADVVRGKIQTAADKIEMALGMTVPLILSFLARLLGLSGIADKVRTVIGRFKTKVDRAIRKFLRKLVGKSKALAKKGIAGAKKLGAAILKRFLPKKRFQAGGEAHVIWMRVDGGPPTPVISSQTQHLSAFLDHLASRKKSDFGHDVDSTEVDAILKATKKGMPKARKLLAEIETVLSTMDGLKNQPNAEALLKPHSQKLQKLETAIAEVISEMMGSESHRPAPAMPQLKKYQLEGMTAAYSALPQARGDGIERDHQPQTALLVHVAQLRLFANRGIRNYVGAKGAPGGVAISIHAFRHRLGRTHGTAGDTTAETAKRKVDQIVEKPEPPDQRRAEIVDVLRRETKRDADKIKNEVLDKRETNKTVFGDIWKLTPKAGISAQEAEARKQKIEIAKTVKQQIRTGIDRIKQQDFDRYQNKP